MQVTAHSTQITIEEFTATIDGASDNRLKVSFSAESFLAVYQLQDVLMNEGYGHVKVHKKSGEKLSPLVCLTDYEIDGIRYYTFLRDL